VDDANIPIYSASLLNPTADSIQYSVTAGVHVPASVTVDVKSFLVGLYTDATGPGDPYISVDLPEYHLKGRTNITITNQTATILDATQFENALASAVHSESFTLEAYGATAAYLGILKANLKLNKKITVPSK